MNGPTVYFQSEGCQFKIHLDKLPVATLPKIKKLFRYIQSEKWNNQVASDAVEAFLPKQIAKKQKGVEAGWHCISKRISACVEQTE